MNKFRLILLVDDDETSNFIAQRQLQFARACDEIITVANGLEARHYICSCDDLPDLVVLDINMPLMNGFEFLDWFDDSKYRGKSKVAIYSTSIREEDRQQAQRYASVISYIEKPLTTDKIADLMRWA
jgi:CheY-like chemotaxis protein